ncbi:MAG: acetate/propionate family kinase [Kiritimatiellales bacterium]
MKILVLNSGSSSLKYKLYEVSEKGEFCAVAAGGAERIGIEGSFVNHKKEGRKTDQVYCDLPSHTQTIKKIFELLLDPEMGSLSSLEELSGVGHRVVHGGEDFTSSVLVDGEVVEAIRKNSVLAPLHNPPNLLGIDAVYKLLPDMKQVAVFDTAVHQTMPPKAYLYGLPKEQYSTYKIRRYGFHGTSHGYVAKKAAEVMGRPIEDLKIITCHLGNGGSITAFDKGKSVDTSMGFTPLAGILMGTRAGDMDPYIPLYIMQSQELTIEQVSAMMNKQGGLLGLCGKCDMRDITAGIEAGHEGCIEALDIFIYRIQKYIGSYIAVLNGVDAIVFTAGIGENVRHVRKRVLENFSYIGVFCNDEANQANETIISTADSNVKSLVIHTDEELVIAQDTFDIITGKRK